MDRHDAKLVFVLGYAFAILLHGLLAAWIHRRRRPGQLESQLFGAANLALAAWHGLQLIELLVVGRALQLGGAATRALLGGQLLLSGLVLALLFQLLCSFERIYRRQAPSLRAAVTNHLHRQQRWYVSGVYLLLIVGLSSYLAEGANLGAAAERLRAAIGPTSAYVFGFALLGMTFVLFPARRGQERILVPVMGRAILMLSLVLNLGLIALWHDRHPTRTALVLLPWLHLHSVGFAIFLALVRYEYSFMDRYVRETLRVASWAAVVAIAYFAFNRVGFSNPQWGPLAASTARLSILLGACALGPWLGGVVARWTDRRLFDRQILPEDAIHGFARRLNRSLDLKELIDGAARDIARAVHAKHVHIVVGGDEHLRAAIASEEKRGGGYRLQVPLGVGEKRSGWILLGERRNLYPYFSGERFFLRLSGELLGSAVAAIRRRDLLQPVSDPGSDRPRDHRYDNLRAEVARLRAAERTTAERFDAELVADALAIAEEASARDPESAARVIASLRRVLQHAMDATQGASTIGREMAFARDFLALQKLRLRNRLEVDLSYDGALEDQLIPFGTLLPLLENVFAHGLRRELRIGWVRVHAQREGQVVELLIEDNGCGAEPDRIDLEGRGGLARAKSALAAQFGEASALLLEQRDDEPGLRVRLRIPWRILEGYATGSAGA